MKTSQAWLRVEIVFSDNGVPVMMLDLEGS